MVVGRRRVCAYWPKEPQVPPLRFAPVEKHFQERTAGPQISPLRYAPVEMTKGRAVLPARVVAERLGFAVACVEMCELSELSKLSQVANPFPPRRDDLSAHEPRMGDGPVCHPAPEMDSGRPGG